MALTAPGQFVSDKWRINRSGRIDLSLRNRYNNSLMWVDAARLPDDLLDASPAIAAHAIVEGLAGGTWDATYVYGRVQYTRRRWATRLLEEAPATVQGHPGHMVLADVMDVAQTQVNPQGGALARTMIVVVRVPSFEHQVQGDQQRRRPALLIAGYANTPAQFDAEVGDFQTLLQSIQVQAAQEDRAPNEATSQEAAEATP